MFFIRSCPLFLCGEGSSFAGEKRLLFTAISPLISIVLIRCLYFLVEKDLVHTKANSLFVLNNKHMLKIIFSVMAIFTMQAIIAQDVDVDKNSGLVKVDGKDAFYLIKKNKVLFNYDLSLQNLDKQELIYFAQKNVDELPYYLRSTHTGTYFFVTFSETANTAYLFPNSFSGMKTVAKQVISANLIKDQQIDPKAERAFVVSHDGNIIKEPETIQVNVNTNANTNSNPSVSSQPADIAIKANNIYNNDERIGTFKQTVKDSITTINIYNNNDDKIAIASHADYDANADWIVTVTADNNTYQILYNTSTPLEKLFKALVGKGLF